MARGSSIHIESTTPGIILHNTREKDSIKNSIFSRADNEYMRDGKIALRIYRAEIEERIQKYQKRMGRKLPKTTKLLFDAVVNLESHHHLRDVKKLARYLEEKLGTRVINITIHRDEGHIEAGKPVINYHAHITFLGLDSAGRSVRKKMTRNFLRQLQDKTAEILKMNRGHSIGRKHISSRDYKYIMQQMEVVKSMQQKNIITEKEVGDYIIKYKAGQITREEAEKKIQEISKLLQSQRVSELTLGQLKSIASLGSIMLAVSHIGVSQGSANAIVRAVERGEAMTLEAMQSVFDTLISTSKMISKMKKQGTWQKIKERTGHGVWIEKKSEPEI